MANTIHEKYVCWHTKYTILSYINILCMWYDQLVCKPVTVNLLQLCKKESSTRWKWSRIFCHVPWIQRKRMYKSKVASCKVNCTLCLVLSQKRSDFKELCEYIPQHFKQAELLHKFIKCKTCFQRETNEQTQTPNWFYTFKSRMSIMMLSIQDTQQWGKQINMQN